jgi:triacylglycerol esterase/lipase EstA (alpha/beta hydrolase family)
LALESVPDSLIRELSKSLPNDWKTVATHLGLSDDEISVIRLNDDQVEEKTNAMLQKWKKKKGKDATRSKLIEVLKKCDRSDLVDKVKRHPDD